MNLICGINPVLEALSAGARHFDRLLVAKGVRNRRISDIIARASQRGIALRFEGRESLDRLSGGLSHQGVIGVVSAKELLDVETLMAEARDPALLVLLDGVEDPRNLGAVLRSVEAAGADGVLLPERHNAGLSETVARVSAGALEYVKVARVGNVVQALEQLKDRGFWIVGFDASAAVRWDAVDLRRSVTLVLGGEGKGIRRLVREHCDQLVCLPLFGHVSSLNVSVAAGIALYEVVRQRGSIPSHVRPIPARPLSAAKKQIIGPQPDDNEEDPGFTGPALRSPAEVELGHETGDEADEGGPQRVSVIDLHEDLGWAQSSQRGAVVIGHYHHPHGKRRHGGGAKPRVDATSAAGRPEARGAESIDSESVRKRGRRRRRRNPRGAGDAAELAGGPTGGQARQPEAAPATQATGERRRRRRWRR
jgi:23S rRNA (guanosine2251-2'-O)-methyltransferase